MPGQQPLAGLEGILREYQGRRGVLLEVFHRVQDAYGYVPPEAIEPIARALRMHAPTVYGTLTFYTEFRTAAPPRVLVNMCLGPTCHLRGAEAIRRILERRLQLDENGRSPDGAVGVHVVQCAGHCHVAPLAYLNGQVRGRLAMSDVVALAEEARFLAGGASA
ncbi:MAG: NAD(P)H-dependent oxidoreductase subunit E [Chloroflexi bacterium]|nr:NAD(P)H-dependent oxidoreductase subunit E [Chloroflexota bacterium]